MKRHTQINPEALAWLLAPDDPGVRYLALRDLCERKGDDPELIAACREAHTHGPIAPVLAAMKSDGYWEQPGPGYLPKYRSTVWAIALLAQLGARVDIDERIATACAYLCDHALLPGGQFTSNGAPSGTVDCLQGNLYWSLMALGWTDPRLDAALEWMARTITGEGVAPMADKKAPVRYYAGKCGPLFACGANNKQACAWGAAKVMLALGAVPAEKRTPLVKRAIKAGIGFLFSIDPADATYPSGWAAKPSGNWWKFGFPLFYITDLLQIVEALAALGYARDKRLTRALSIVREKADAQGRWPLEYGYAGKTWVNFGVMKQPNRWVTLRALRVLKAAGG